MFPPSLSTCVDWKRELAASACAMASLSMLGVDALETVQDIGVSLLWDAQLTLWCCMQAEGDLDEPKFACNVSDELAEKIARNVRLSLKDYVFYV